jgi:septal ring factor EnvC (AmiA/AmiB activator)
MNQIAVRLFYALASLLFFSVLPSALSAQEPPPSFSSITDNLTALENLITDTLNDNETLTQQLQHLQQNLTERETLLTEREQSLNGKEKTLTTQENLLKELRQQLSEMSTIYKEQSLLSAKYERRYKFWKRFTLIGIPAAVLLSGGITALALSAR